jgi:hypothetical protein
MKLYSWTLDDVYALGVNDQLLKAVLWSMGYGGWSLIRRRRRKSIHGLWTLLPSLHRHPLVQRPRFFSWTLQVRYHILYIYVLTLFSLWIIIFIWYMVG